jgi:predicted AlkP superfamily phosphohydrolase/phosphomutase
MRWSRRSSEGFPELIASPPRNLDPVLVLALDGATFDVVAPMAKAGRLPHLARWMEQGSHAPLPSVTPPVTFPAWSSFATGLHPGRHGVFDFTHKVPGAYRLRFTNASDRAGQSIFRRVSDAGGRVLVLGLPATFPPEPVSGLLVSGFDAPVSSGTDARSASDPDLYAQIAAAAGPWMRPDLDESARDVGFHERAAGTLVSRVERKTRFAKAALEAMRRRDGARPDLMMVVFSESDTIGHHGWRDHDPNSPRHDPSAGPERRDAVARVYAALDSACGELRRAYGEDARCVVLSDHGMGGASRRVVFLNRFLEERGLLARKRRGAVDRLARTARDTALRWLPAAAAQAIFRRARSAAARLESSARFGGFAWERTRAFSEEANTLPGVWINVRGREARGCVDERDYEKVRDEVIAALSDWRLPSDGGGGSGPVVRRARRREEVYEGPYVDRAPDIVIELALDAGYGLSLVPTPWAEPASLSVRTLPPEEWGGGRGRGMNGTHRPDGIWIDAGPGRGNNAVGTPSGPSPADLAAVAPWLLRHLGLDDEIEGADARSDDRTEYTAEENEMVARRLRALGYLE